MTHPQWQSLPFEGFSEEELTRKLFWEKVATDILVLEKSGERVGVVLDTGGGKTIIALLVILAQMGERVLFLAPQKILTAQHNVLGKTITGGKVKSRVITGETPAKERIWNDDTDRIIFATPHVVMSESRYGSEFLSFFQRVVIDEFHKARGEYPYVPICKISLSFGSKVLALSASPGTTVREIETVKRNCGVTTLLPVRWKGPKRVESLMVQALNPHLLKIKERFQIIFPEVEGKFRELLKSLNYRLDRKKREFIPQWTLKAIETHLHNLLRPVENPLERVVFKEFDRLRALSMLALYRKLRHSHKVLILESYETFELYIKKLSEEDTSNAAKRLLKHPVFQEIVGLLREDHPEHPKVIALSALLESQKRMSQRGIVYFSQKDTARALQLKISSLGLKTEIVFGGKDKDVGHQMKVLQQLKKGEIDFVLSTSVLLEGVSIPEIHTFIYYGMPEDATAMIQGGGRVARTHTGYVMYLPMKDTVEERKYWNASSGVSRMRVVVNNSFLSRNKFMPKKRKRLGDRSQLLFEYFSESE